MNDNLYFYLKDLDNSFILKHLIILSLLIIIFRTIHLDISMLFAFFMAYLIMRINYDKNKFTIDNEQTILNKKYNLMKVRPVYIINNINPDTDLIITTLYDLYDLGVYNLHSFDETVKYIDLFYKLYDDMKNETMYMHDQYSILLSYKNNVLNSIHSIVHTLYDKQQIKKLETIIDKFNKILTNRTNEFYVLNDINYHSLDKNKLQFTFNIYEQNK